MSIFDELADFRDRMGLNSDNVRGTPEEQDAAARDNFLNLNRRASCIYPAASSSLQNISFMQTVDTVKGEKLSSYVRGDSVRVAVPSQGQKVPNEANQSDMISDFDDAPRVKELRRGSKLAQPTGKRLIIRGVPLSLDQFNETYSSDSESAGSNQEDFVYDDFEIMDNRQPTVSFTPPDDVRNLGSRDLFLGQSDNNRRLQSSDVIYMSSDTGDGLYVDSEERRTGGLMIQKTVNHRMPFVESSHRAKSRWPGGSGPPPEQKDIYLTRALFHLFLEDKVDLFMKETDKGGEQHFFFF